MTKILDHEADSTNDANGVVGSRRSRELDLIARILPAIKGVRTGTILEVEAAIEALRSSGKMPKILPADVPSSVERFKGFEIKDLPIGTATKQMLSRGKIGKDVERRKNTTVQELIDLGEETVLDFATTVPYKQNIKVLFRWLERAAIDMPLTADELAMNISELLLTPEVKKRLSYEYYENDYERSRALGYNIYGSPDDTPNIYYRFDGDSKGHIELSAERRKLLEGWECIEYPDSGASRERSDAHIVFYRPKSSIKTLGDLLRLGRDGLEDKRGIRREDMRGIEIFLENFCNTKLPNWRTRE